MKQCSRCKETKPLDKFGKEAKSKDGLQYHCKVCKAELHILNHEARMVSIRASKQRRVDAGRNYVVEWFKTHPCVDCGETDIRVLEFDHLGNKVDGVAKMVREGQTLKRIKQEIEKCEVRCKNDHARKSFERLGGTWHDKFIGLS